MDGARPSPRRGSSRERLLGQKRASGAGSGDETLSRGAFRWIQISKQTIKASAKSMACSLAACCGSWLVAVNVSEQKPRPGGRATTARRGCSGRPRHAAPSLLTQRQGCGISCFQAASCSAAGRRCWCWLLQLHQATLAVT